MSAFEYASVVVSIVLALGIADILRFLADSIRPLDANRLYWVHFLWILVLLDAHVEFWLRMWDFRALVAVGPMLSLLLAGPALLFIATRVLLPLASDEGKMEVLYFRNRKLFFALLIVMNLWSLAVGPWSISGNPDEQLIYGLLMTVLMVGMSIACMLSENRRLHQTVVLLVVAVETLEFFSMFYLPTAAAQFGSV